MKHLMNADTFESYKKTNNDSHSRTRLKHEPTIANSPQNPTQEQPLQQAVHDSTYPHSPQKLPGKYKQECQRTIEPPDTHPQPQHTKPLHLFKALKSEDYYHTSHELPPLPYLERRGYKPFECEICDRAFANKVNMEHHRKTHTDTFNDDVSEWLSDLVPAPPTFSPLTPSPDGQPAPIRRVFASHSGEPVEYNNLQPAPIRGVFATRSGEPVGYKNRQPAPIRGVFATQSGEPVDYKSLQPAPIRGVFATHSGEPVDYNNLNVRDTPQIRNNSRDPQTQHQTDGTVNLSLTMQNPSTEVNPEQLLKATGSQPPSLSSQLIEASQQRITTDAANTFECILCRKKFPSLTDLNQHEVIHNIANSFECDICGKKFRDRKRLKAHGRNHYTFACKTCNTKFKCSTALKMHETRHTGEELVCKLCNKKFKLLNSLKQHQRIHSGEKPFKCMICGNKFRHSSSLRAHVVKHADEEHPVGKKLTKNGKLKAQKVVFADVERFECKTCNKRCASLLQLKEHVQTHVGELPFDCKICSKKFTRLCKFKEHESAHTGLKNFQCKFCSKKFWMSYDLTRHERLHADPKPFECKICGKKFARNGNLKIHAAVHTEKKTFECRICHKTFAWAGSWKRHEKGHGEKAIMDISGETSSSPVAGQNMEDDS